MITEIQEIEAAMERALKPGKFIKFLAGARFTLELRKVEKRIAALGDADKEDSADQLYKVFIAACYEKGGEFDDSDGSLGMFITELFKGWIRCRESAGMDPEKTMSELHALEEADPIGFCYELYKSITAEMGPALLECYIRYARNEFRISAPDDGELAGGPRRHWTDVLKYLLCAQGNEAGFLQFCGSADVSSEDCFLMAKSIRNMGNPNGAMSWVIRGLAFDDKTGSGLSVYDLKRLQQELLLESGKTDEVLDLIWCEFQRFISSDDYDAVLELAPTEEKQKWHERMMAVAERSKFSHAQRFFMERKELERLARCVDAASNDDIRDLYYTEPIEIARILEKQHPATSVRIYRVMSLRILDEGRSKAYKHALRYLEHIRKFYLENGMEKEWESLEDAIRKKHRRKSGFMPGFERLIAGGPAIERVPTILERAKKRLADKGRIDLN